MMKKILMAMFCVVAATVHAEEIKEVPHKENFYTIYMGGVEQTYRMALLRHGDTKFVKRIDDWTITSHPEYGISYWHGPKGNVVQGSYDWMFRLHFHPRWFAEYGHGASIFSHRTWGDSKFSTNWQLNTHAGVGWKYEEDKIIGFRISHFSNASIKKPNPGANAFQLTYTFKF